MFRVFTIFNITRSSAKINMMLGGVQEQHVEMSTNNNMGKTDLDIFYLVNCSCALLAANELCWGNTSLLFTGCVTSHPVGRLAALFSGLLLFRILTRILLDDYVHKDTRTGDLCSTRVVFL